MNKENIRRSHLLQEFFQEFLENFVVIPLEFISNFLKFRVSEFFRNSLGFFWNSLEIPLEFFLDFWGNYFGIFSKYFSELHSHKSRRLRPLTFTIKMNGINYHQNFVRRQWNSQRISVMILTKIVLSKKQLASPIEIY